MGQREVDGVVHCEKAKVKSFCQVTLNKSLTRSWALLPPLTHGGEWNDRNTTSGGCQGGDRHEARRAGPADDITN